MKQTKQYWEFVPIRETLALLSAPTGAPMEQSFFRAHLRVELLAVDVVDTLERVQEAIDRDDLSATSRLLRFAGNQIAQARGECALLSEMRPTEFREFRWALGSVSGFQSPGIRAIQFFCGLRDERVLGIFEGSALYDAMKYHWARRSIWDAFRGQLIRSTLCADSAEEQIETMRLLYRDEDSCPAAFATLEGLRLFDLQYRHFMADHLMTALSQNGHKKPGTGADRTSTIAPTTEMVLLRGVIAPLFPLLWEAITTLPEERSGYGFTASSDGV